MTPVQGLDPARIESSTRGFPLCPRAQAGPPPLHHARRKGALSQRPQPALGRAGAGRAALIPAQDERRQICEDVSRHTSIGLRYLCPIARTPPPIPVISADPSISSPGSTTRRSTSATSMHCSPSSPRARNGPEREIDIRSSTGAHVSGHGHWPDRRITRPARPCHTPLLCPRQRHPATSGIFHTFLVNYVTVTGARSR
jgi:hypothetical protein